MRIYKISTNHNDEPQVVEMMVRKETDKTITVSDGFMAYTVRKADLPFNWRLSTLITDDPAKGRIFTAAGMEVRDAAF
jgi:hypothetical protein